MLAAIVKLPLGGNFNECTVRKIAESGKGRFEGMPGLRSKVFTFDPDKGEVDEFVQIAELVENRSN